MANRNPLVGPEDPRHGTENAYNNYACRCRPCKDSHAKYVREHRKKRTALKTKYRMARDAGYPSREAARRSHWSDPLREE